MATIKIYGSSDDLVEVEGSVPGCNEFGTYNRPLYVELSTGDVFKVEYTGVGVWEVTHHVNAGVGGVTWSKINHGAGDDPEPYTDTVTASGAIEWVEAWESYPPTPEEMKTKMAYMLGECDESIDSEGILNNDEVRAVWAIIANAERRTK